MTHLLQHFRTLVLTILLAAFLVSGSGEARAAVSQDSPRTYVLTPAYPNPFNPTTSFSLTVQQRQQVAVEVYNMLGQPVRELFRGMMQVGETRTFHFDAGDLPTGIYFYRVTGESFRVARQITLIR